MANIKVFEKWVKLQGQKFCYQQKGLVIRNTHMKYESPITCHLKDMANVKVFEKWVKLQGQKFWYQSKGLVIRYTHMKSLSLPFKRYGQC
jgi:hypothetical protein